MPLIQITRQKSNEQQAAPFQLVQNRQQRVAVFSAGQADQPAGPRLNHSIVTNCLAGLAHKTLAQFLKLGRARGATEEQVDISCLI